MKQLITLLLCGKNIINHEDIEEYLYGLEIIELKVIHFSFIMCIAIFSEKGFESITFLYIYSSIEAIIGGYHSKSRIFCLIISMLRILFICYTIEKYTYVSISLLSFIMILSFGYIAKKLFL